jgi:hypothetical protein
MDAGHVDLTTDGVLVHRDPRGGIYGSVIRIEGAGVTIPVAEVVA